MSIGGTGSGIVQRAIADVYPPRKSKPTGRRSVGPGKLVLALVMLYLLIPLGATLWFGLDTGHGIDFSIFGRIFSDPDFSQTLLTSLELALGATILAVVLVTPTAYWVQLRLPTARPFLDFLTLAPFAVPAILLAVALLRQSIGPAIPLINSLSLTAAPSFSNTIHIITP